MPEDQKELRLSFLNEGRELIKFVSLQVEKNNKYSFRKFFRLIGFKRDTDGTSRK